MRVWPVALSVGVLLSSLVPTPSPAAEKVVSDRESGCRIRAPRHAQQFLSAHGPIHQHTHPRRHRMSAAEYRAYRAEAFAVWHQETCVRKAA